MDADQSNDMTRGSDATGGIEPQHPLEKVLDLIARNDKDVDRPEQTVQAAQVNRHRGVAALAVSDPLRPDQSLGGSRRAQAAPSTTELVTSVLRYKWTLVLVAAVVSAPIIAVIWTQIMPEYTARAEVRVRPIIPRLVFRTDDNGAIPFYESFVNTQVSVMRSLTVLQRVLDQEQVQQTEWYKNTAKTLLQQVRGDSTPPIERLRRSLSVRPRSRTEIIDVSFTDTSARDAKLIVDTVLNEYLKHTGEATNAEDEKLYRQLVDQYKSLESEIQGREKVCAELRKSLETQTPEELISSKRVRLDAVQARLSELRSNVDLLEWEAAQIAGTDSNGVSTPSVDTVDKRPEYYEDAEWRRLYFDVRAIQHQMANSVYKPNHPDSLQLAKDLDFAKELLGEREVQLNEQWRNRPIGVTGVPTIVAGAGSPLYREGSISLAHQLARAKQEEQLVLAEYNREQQEFATLFESAQLLDRETNALQHKRELFEAVRQRLDQKNIERNVPGSIDVLMWAFSPSRPDQDRRVVFTAMALVFGLGMGGGVAFLRASRNQTIRAFKDLPQPTQAPLLGRVPLVRTTKPLGRSLCDEIEQNQFVLVESIRVLRTALLSRLDGESGTTVLVTSAGEGTGKSSFTMMLGKSIAQAGRKVLMIDADFHRMTLSRRFDLLDKSGFMEVLGDKATDELPIFSTKTPGLDIMPTGKRSHEGAAFEAIANGAFKACIGRIREHCSYDIILLDTSPVLPVADATILAGQVDGTIMVEREQVSQRTHVMDALARLHSTGGRLLGTVFVGSLSREHYGYGYSYGHGRHGRTGQS